MSLLAQTGSEHPSLCCRLGSGAKYCVESLAGLAQG